MLTEISLNVIDIAQNSLRAGASRIDISIVIDRSARRLTLRIEDDGIGMNAEEAAQASDPFFTSRMTRNVGFGLPFLKQAATCTGGSFRLDSAPGKGAVVEAVFAQDHIDCIPLGDINASLCALLNAEDDVEYRYRYEVDGRNFVLDTREVNAMLQGVSLREPAVSSLIKSFLDENKKIVDEGGIHGGKQ